MALVGCTSDLGCCGGRFEDHSEQKMHRAASRARSQYLKRVAYKEKTAKAQLRRSASHSLPAAPVGNDRMNPHGIKRAAVRTWLTKGMVEKACDMPTISMGRPGRWVPWVRKPSVAPLLGHMASEGRIYDDEIEMNSVSNCPDACGDAKIKYDDDDDVATTCPNSPDLEILPPPVDLDEEDGDEALQLLAPSVGEEEEEAYELEHGHMKLAKETQVDAEAKESSGQSMSSTRSSTAQEADTANDVAETLSSEIQRELVMQRVIKAQRIQAREAESKLAAAIARADEAERREREAEQYNQKVRCTDLHQASHIGKRMSAELRRKRNQDAHQRALLEKAERTLQEARQAKESAEADALAEQARILAATQAAAQIEANNKVQDVVAIAEEQAKAMLDKRLEAVARIEAELRANAEAETAQARRTAEEMAHAVRSRAEAESRAIREKAEADARTLSQRVQSALRSKAERVTFAYESALAEARAKANVDVQACAVVETSNLETSNLAHREAAESLKRAKEQEQHRAKQFRKQAEQQRRQEHEQQKLLAAARNEGRAMNANAIAEAKGAQEQAEAKVRELEAMAREMQATAAEKTKLEAQARARLVAAEAQASAIRARAEEEARLLRDQVLRASAKAQESFDAQASEDDVVATLELAEELIDETNDWQILPDISATDIADVVGWDLVE